MANAKHLVLVRTRHPDASKISYKWAESVKTRFIAHGWHVTDLAINDAIRQKIEDILKNSENTVFIFYGHGMPDKMVGQNGNSAIDLSNLNLLSQQIVYVVACYTAKILGVASASVARCYIGYDQPVIVYFDSPYVDCLEECVNKAILIMLDEPNHTIEKARNKAIEIYSQWIDYFTIGHGASGIESFQFAADLRHNRDALVQVYGDKSAMLPC